MRLLDVNLLFFSDVTHNIPVQIWLGEGYPYNPPMVFVMPTSTIEINRFEYVGFKGQVRHLFLDKWKVYHKGYLVTEVNFFLCV